jgi:hypothetical protein
MSEVRGDEVRRIYGHNSIQHCVEVDDALQAAEQRAEKAEARATTAAAQLAERGGRTIPLDNKTHYEESLEAQVAELEADHERVLEALKNRDNEEECP